MAVTTAFKRATLEDSYDAAKGSNKTIRQVLRTAESAALKSAKGGELKSVAANGRSTVWQDGSSQSEMVGVWRELIDLYDRSKTFLDNCAKRDLDPDTQEEEGNDWGAVTVPDGAATEQAIFDWMMARLVAPDSVGVDCSDLRLV